MAAGRFIVFEGIDGCGKSTQAELLATERDALLTHQPGGTDIGVALRKLLLSPDAAARESRTEALLMAADRAEHVASVIRPALISGRDVVCDRYTASSVAYQGYGRGLDPGEIERLSDWATEKLVVDLYVLVDVPLEVARERVGSDRDRFEREGDDFAERVARGFHLQAEGDSSKWLVVDGTQAVDDVARAVTAGVSDRLAW